MDGFVGFVSLGAGPAPGALTDRILEALPTNYRGAGRIARTAHGFIGHEASKLRGRPGYASHASDARWLFGATARVDNRDDLAIALGIDRRTLSQTSDAALVVRAYQAHGDGGLAKIVGAFAFVCWDETRRRLILARDCLGDVPLFYFARPEFVAFATTLTALLALPNVPRVIDEVVLGHQVAGNFLEPRRTVYRGIERVPSGTCVTIDSASVRHKKYWSPNLATASYPREQDYIERARELFDQAVVAALRDAPRAALLLSGGLDFERDRSHLREARAR